MSRIGPSRYASLGLAVALGSAVSAHGGGRTHPYCGVIVPASSARLADAGSTVNPIGSRKLLYIRIRYADETKEPVSIDEAQGEISEADTIFERISFGNFRLVGTVTSPVILTATSKDYLPSGGFDRLLTDARAAAAAAGFDYRDYDLEAVRHSGVSSFQAGNANLGTRGLQIQAPGAVILVHEIGHNLGVLHANYWDTSLPPLVGASPPLPSNSDDFPDPRTIPIYPDSAVGHPSVEGAGFAAEYGDFYDIMGSGTEQFNAGYKHTLGWLPDANVRAVNSNGTFRLFSAEEATIRADRAYALRVGSGAHETWVQLAPIGVPEEAGKVSLRWYDSAVAPINALLLDAPLKLPAANSDALLELGRTHSQKTDGVHITPIATGSEGGDHWVDVVVHRNTSASNGVPTINSTKNDFVVGANELVTLEATATDPDGDPLAWHWDFQDGTFSTTPGIATNSWRRIGDFVVLLTVSDMKGGVAYAQFVVLAGQPTTARVLGTILDQDGLPVPGVKVHNGVLGSPGDRSPYRSTLTDSNGRYTLANLIPSTYTNGAYLYGYRIGRVPPVVLGPNAVVTQDYTAVALPTLTITAPEAVSESAGIVSLFTLTRSGDTNDSLTITYGLEGSAQAGLDYVRPFISRVSIPAGERSANVIVNLINDQIHEPTDTLTLNATVPTDALRVDSHGNPYIIYYPGWDIVQIGQRPYFVQTDSPLVVAPGPVVSIIDDDSTLSVRRGLGGSLSLVLTGDTA